MEKPTIAQKSPYVLDNQAGDYFWCACGKSANQPFCDGSHKGSEYRSLKTNLESKGKKAWCGCKHSKHPPFCDGSHVKL
jgi:CDGSH-type Zn-finger protein